MKPRALVVDDDPEITKTVGEILASLNHDYDTADSVAAARQLVDCKKYDYFLIDLQLPVHSGHGLARIQNGENLIDELIRQDDRRKRQIIAITAHGNDRPIQPVEMMKKGIADYIPKPFEETGKTLDRAILEMLSRLEGMVRTSPEPNGPDPLEAELVPFTGGKMVFFSDRVELCGAKLYRKRTLKRCKALELLAAKREIGFDGYSCEDLERELGLGVNCASGLIRDIRNRISQVMRDEAKVECGEEDAILSGGPGFRLSEKLTVQFVTGIETDKDQGHSPKKLRFNVPNRVPDVLNPHVPNVPDEGDSVVRRNWILARLEGGNRICAKDVVFEYGCCRRTALRDLRALVKDGLIERVGTRRKSNYRLCGAGKSP